jgi:hypothetical protein
VADEFVVIQRFASNVEAQIAEAVLVAHEIPCFLLRDDAGGMIPALHVLFPARLAVPREYAEEARRILATPPGGERDPDDVDDYDVDGPDDEDEPWKG